MNPTELAASGPLLLAALVAVLAGLVSFASPCVVPLVPGYLAYLAGLVGADAPAVTAGEEKPKTGKGKVAGAAALFVLGFTVVFCALTVTVFGVTTALRVNEDLLQRIGGVVTIALALVFIGLVPGAQRTLRLRFTPRASLIGAPLLGGVFALGWTPCIGPTLAGVLSLTAGTEAGSSTTRGVLLIVLYCLGLGLPFVVIAVGARWAISATAWIKRHVRGVQIFGGVLLLLVGIALVTGLWGSLIAWIQGNLVSNTELPI